MRGQHLAQPPMGCGQPRGHALMGDAQLASDVSLRLPVEVDGPHCLAAVIRQSFDRCPDRGSAILGTDRLGMRTIGQVELAVPMETTRPPRGEDMRAMPLAPSNIPLALAVEQVPG